MHGQRNIKTGSEDQKVLLTDQRKCEIREFRSSAMWRRVVAWVVPDVSETPIAFTFSDQGVLLDCVTLAKLKTIFFKSTHPKTLRQGGFAPATAERDWVQFNRIDHTLKYIFYFNTCIVHLLLFCIITNKRTINPYPANVKNMVSS
jgi:hypothetical protein